MEDNLALWNWQRGHLKNGNGIGISRGGGGIPFASDLSFLAKSRSGYNMVDDFGNNASILPSLLSITKTYSVSDGSASQNLAVKDNGVLDIGGTDFCVFGWFYTSDTVAYYPFISKRAADVSGEWAIRASATNKLRFAFVTSTGLLNTDTSVDIATGGWMHLLCTINQTTKIAKIYVNNTQIGSDISFTGTFGSPSTDFKTCIGAFNNAGGTDYITKNTLKAYNVGIIHRIPTDAERLTLYQKGFITLAANDAFWPLNRSYNDKFYDVSGSNLHMIGYGFIGSGNNSTKYIESHGSLYNLNYGYDIYEDTYKLKIQVPHKMDGTSLSGITDTLIRSVAGSLIKHNLADSKIKPIDAIWDKSDAAIHPIVSRLSTFYNSSYPKEWHISELDKSQFDKSFITGYKNRCYPKITNNSYNDRIEDLRLLTYSTDRSASQNISVLSYTGDSGIRQNKIRAGICFTFDDSAHLLEWAIADKTLYATYQWKATFVLEVGAQYLNYQHYTRQLLAHGHELMNHSRYHDDWITYLATHTDAELFARDVTEAEPFFQTMYGYKPNTLGMWQVVGRDEDFFDYCLANGISYVRAYRTDIPADIMEVCYDGTSQKLDALQLNATSYPLNSAGNAALLATIDYALANDVIIVYNAHAIGDAVLPLSRVEMMCARVVANNMTFYGASELIPALFGL